MQLVAFTVENYRRFRTRTSVKLHSSMIALVGPNEAGKSSLLHALSLLDNDEPFASRDRPRRTSLEPRLEWTFQLDPVDQKALSKISGVPRNNRVTVIKTSTGRSVAFPKPPRRLLPEVDELRSQILAGLDRFEESDVVTSAIRLTDILTEENLEQVTDERRAQLSDLQFTLENDFDDPNLESMASKLTKLRDVLDTKSPAELASEYILKILPGIVVFTQEDRDLKSEYEVTTEEEAPPALRHLAALADLDLDALHGELQNGDVADAGERRDEANERLRTVFSETWNQKAFSITLDLDFASELLHVQVRDELGRSDLRDRSDGMRWFAALLSFVHGWQESPILLADEVETHLHYDAQSDLLEVLSAQEFTSKVIYTTHSFGCLPNDLGNGVRAVVQTDNGGSKLVNDFWSSGSGFGPLLAKMGATAASFTPARRALMGEGIAEAILLPTLLREVSGEASLSFQVVPGLSALSLGLLSDHLAEAGSMAFFTDGDAAGRALAKSLQENPGAVGRVVSLISDDVGYELEDFVETETYVKAVNAQLELWNDGPPVVSINDLPGPLVTKQLKLWCEDRGLTAPDKGPIAERIVEMAHAELNGGRTTIVKTERVDWLRRIYREIEVILR